MSINTIALISLPGVNLYTENRLPALIYFHPGVDINLLFMVKVYFYYLHIISLFIIFSLPRMFSKLNQITRDATVIDKYLKSMFKRL